VEVDGKEQEWLMTLSSLLEMLEDQRLRYKVKRNKDIHFSKEKKRYLIHLSPQTKDFEAVLVLSERNRYSNTVIATYRLSKLRKLERAISQL
jgi:hypothetical protein